MNIPSISNEYFMKKQSCIKEQICNMIYDGSFVLYYGKII